MNKKELPYVELNYNKEDYFRSNENCRRNLSERISKEIQGDIDSIMLELSYKNSNYAICNRLDYIVIGIREKTVEQDLISITIAHKYEQSNVFFDSESKQYEIINYKDPYVASDTYDYPEDIIQEEPYEDVVKKINGSDIVDEIVDKLAEELEIKISNKVKDIVKRQIDYVDYYVDNELEPEELYSD